MMLDMEQIHLFLVGDNEDDAKKGLIFDSFDSALEHAQSEGSINIYTVVANIDFSTIELAV